MKIIPNSIVQIITITFILINCCYSQNYFEGEIEYQLSYEPINKNISSEILQKEFGKSFTAYVKEDRYALIYHAEGKQGWMKVIVRLDEGFSYTEFEKSDTISKTKFGSEKEELISFKRNTNDKKKVLGTDCESISINYKPKDVETSFFQLHKGTYYFDPKYKLNSRLYSNYTDGFWNLYVKESEAVSIRNEVEFYPLFKSIQEASSIEQKKVDDSVFEPNSKKVILMSN